MNKHNPRTREQHEPIPYRLAFWAKTKRDNPSEIHRLEFHLADVAAVMERLLKVPGIKRATARAGDLMDLPDSIAARICVFAALHDIGKANICFQKKVWPPPEKRSASHTKDMMQLLNGKDEAGQKKLMQSLSILNEALELWDSRSGDIVCGMMLAAMSHHGTPERLQNNNETRHEHWSPDASLGDPFAKIADIDRMIRQWFPKAFEPDAPPLPENPRFQHHFLGLLMLADWIGSDERFFPYQGTPDSEYIKSARHKATKALRTIGIDTGEIRLPLRTPSFAELFGIEGAVPNAIQKKTLEVPLDAQMVIVEAETGAGKTEAALMRFEKMLRAGLVDSLYFALPTRAAAVQIHRRVNEFVQRAMAGTGTKATLAVPGYHRHGDVEGIALSRYDVHWEDGGNDGQRWSAEGAKCFLAAQIAVGTIDQAMLSALQTKHAHMRAACLSRSLLVIDEVHASDTYMRHIMSDMVLDHIDKGGYTLMMSATLGEAARSEWLETPMLPREAAIKVPYPSVSTKGHGPQFTGENQAKKRVKIEILTTDDGAAVTSEIALKAAKDGAKVMVIRNTVRQAMATLEKLESMTNPEQEEDLLFRAEGVSTLHHSRFAAADRRTLDAAVERDLGHQRSTGGKVIIGTQTLEQSLDIDADLMITDLCPMDVLLQRIGRLHRKPRPDRPEGYREARCIVMVPEAEIRDLIPGKGERNNTGLGPNGMVYQDLRVIEATKRQLAGNPVWEIPAMNRELVERATHPTELEAIVKANPADWQEHDNSIKGLATAERQSAEAIIIDRSVPFYDGDMGDNDKVVWNRKAKAYTRLGEATIDIDVEPAEKGPFGNDVDQLSIPHWMVKENLADYENLKAEILHQNEQGFDFLVPNDNRTFRYDRFGIRRPVENNLIDDTS